MPIIDGYEASKTIKNLVLNENFLNVKIIGNSGLLLEEDIKKSHEHLMDDVLLKPASKDEIKFKVS